jgi:membrane associated rhomboid family serine protease
MVMVSRYTFYGASSSPDRQLIIQIYGLIAVNVGVYLLWQYAMQSWQRFRDPSLYYWLVNNFVLNEANIMGGRIWTLVTACFSHSSGQHIFMNCLGLYFIAPAVAG